MIWSPTAFIPFPDNRPHIEIRDSDEFIAMAGEALGEAMVREIWAVPGSADRWRQVDLRNVGENYLGIVSKLPITHQFPGPEKLRIKSELFIHDELVNNHRRVKAESIDLEQARKTGMILITAAAFPGDGFSGAYGKFVVSIDGSFPTPETLDYFEVMAHLQRSPAL